jgi:transposase-like protein
MQIIRIISEISANIKILPAKQTPLYQKISLTAKQLYALEMSYRKISIKLNVGETTVVRACKYKHF